MARKPNASYDVDMVKSAARGRWPEILSRLGNIAPELLDGKHHPCPKQCSPNSGGDDRFRLVDADAGALFCNQCFTSKNGDGLAAVQWLCGVKFGEALARVADYLGIEPQSKNSNGKAKSKSQPATEKRRFATLYDAVKCVYAGLIKDNLDPAREVVGWDYQDAAGKNVMAVVRYATKNSDGTPSKTYRPFGADGDKWLIGDPAGKLPLYELRKLGESDTIYIVEGEKCAEAGRERLGITTTTSAHGSKSPQLTDWSPLAGKRVIFLPDNDDPGGVYVNAIAGILRSLDPPAVATIRRLPDLPPGGDICDWLDANEGRSVVDMLAELESLPDEIPGEPGRPEVNEADDDPHRLARVNLERYGNHSTGATLRYWRDEFYTWKPSRGCYRKIGLEELRAKLNASIKAEFDRLNVEALERFREREKAGTVEEGELPPQAKKVTKTLVTNVLDATKSLAVIPSSVELMTWLDGTARERRNYVAMRNGVLDLDAVIADRDDYLLPHSAQWFSTASLPFPYDPNANCPTWKAFLDYNLRGDKELICRLQEWAGYLLLPDTGYQKFLLMKGDGSNGKSVYMAAITAMLGQENVSNVSLEVFGDRFSRTDTLGKLANIAGDCEELDKVAEGYIKSFTSGDRMYFDRKGVSGINCVPTARLMISCNELPRLRDRSDGIWRRMLLVPWDRKIEDSMKVRNMDKPAWWEQSGELAGILNWAIVGLHRLREQGGFTDASASRSATSDYQKEMNSARAFLLESVTEAFDPDYVPAIRVDFLYSLYSAWAKSGNQHPFAKPTFSKEVYRVFKNSSRGQFREAGSGGDRRRHYVYKNLEFVRDEICGQPTADTVALSSQPIEEHQHQLKVI